MATEAQALSRARERRKNIGQLWEPTAAQRELFTRLTGGKFIHPESVQDAERIRKIQEEFGKKVDGIIGPETFAALRRREADAARKRFFESQLPSKPVKTTTAEQAKTADILQMIHDAREEQIIAATTNLLRCSYTL